jgi:hypothetical protein
LKEAGALPNAVCRSVYSGEAVLIGVEFWVIGATEVGATNVVGWYDVSVIMASLT